VLITDVDVFGINLIDPAINSRAKYYREKAGYGRR
jgi:hypothetical protein